MNDGNVFSLQSPAKDALTELVRNGAQQILAQAIEAEIATFLAANATVQTADGKRAVVRNGYLPERTIQTGIGDLEVQVPKVRDRSGSGIKFNSALVPPYLKRTKTLEDFIPWLYLRGVSTGDMQPALEALLGKGAKGLSPNTVSRLKSQWEGEYEAWRSRDLSKRRYVYIWVDGIYCNVRLDDKLCLLVIMGSDDTGRKELLAVADGYRENEASWTDVLNQLESQGLTVPPKLAIGDGALGFWKALTKKWPTTQAQRCWVHKTANILNKAPKSVQPRMKEALQDIWMAESQEKAYKAFDAFEKRYSAKYPKATECLKRDRDRLLAFYSFPAEHWPHIRTTNPIESLFATVRLRTDKVKNCGSRTTTLAMVFKLATIAEKKWRRLRGYKLLADVIEGVPFKDGIRMEPDHQQGAAIHQI